MKQSDPKRNKSAEEGKNDDPQLRDDSGIRPGINTVSTGKNDEDDNRLTETAADNFKTENQSEAKPDRTFDQVDYD
jgi:hypothetical protein